MYVSIIRFCLFLWFFKWSFWFLFKIIRNAFYQEKKFQEKSCFADIVTETDEKIEKLLFGMIKQKYENHLFIGEESTNKKIDFTDDPVWIIDPVDGTTNFYHK